MRRFAGSLCLFGAAFGCSRSHSAPKLSPPPGHDARGNGDNTGVQPTPSPAYEFEVEKVLERSLGGKPLAIGGEYLAASLLLHGDGRYVAHIARGFSDTVNPEQGSEIDSTWTANGTELLFQGLGTGLVGVVNDAPGISLTISDSVLGLGERTLLLNDSYVPPKAPSSSNPTSTVSNNPITPAPDTIGTNPASLKGHTMVFQKDLVATTDQITNSSDVVESSSASVDLENGVILARNAPWNSTVPRCTITVYGPPGTTTGPTTLVSTSKTFQIELVDNPDNWTILSLSDSATHEVRLLLTCSFDLPGASSTHELTTSDIKTALGDYAEFK